MGKKINSIFIVDDDSDFRKLLSVRLKKLFPDAELVEYDILSIGTTPSEDECEKHDVMILDHDLAGDVTGLSWFKSCGKIENFPATVMLTVVGNERTAIHALNSGVHYYLVKQKLTDDSLEKGIIKAFEIRVYRIFNSSTVNNHVRQS